MEQLFISDSFAPDKGGSREYYYQVCKHLKIPVLTQKNKKAIYFDKKQNFRIIRKFGIRPNYTGRWNPNIPWVNILINFIPPLIWTSFWTLVYTIKTRQDITHAGGFQFAGFSAILMKLIFGIPFILYAHGEEILANNNARYMSKYLRWVFSKADRVIANSEYTKKLLISIGVFNNRISIVNPGISRRFFSPPDNIEQVRKTYHLDGSTVLLSVGRLTKRKGHSLILKRLPKLIREFPNLVYVIAGDGIEMNALIDLTQKLNLQRHVVFTGEIDNQKLCSLYWICNIFILANRDLLTDIEGFGMVFLEAGAAEKPVIGGCSGGVVEAIQNTITGYLIDSENPEEIITRIKAFLNHPELCRFMGEKGRIWSKSFLWTKQISRISNVIEMVAKQT